MELSGRTQWCALIPFRGSVWRVVDLVRDGSRNYTRRRIEPEKYW